MVRRGIRVFLLCVALIGAVLLAKLFTEKMGFRKFETPPQNAKADLWKNGPHLRGVNLWQKRIDPAVDGDGLGTGKIGPEYQDWEWAALRALGANYVNLSVPGPFTEKPPYEWDEEVALAIDQLVASAARHDLFVAISFRTGPGRNEAGFDSSESRLALHSVWKEPNAQAAWVQMWKKAAERFGRQAHVVGYGLMVEPNGNEVLFRISDSTTFYATQMGGLSDWNQLAGRLAKAVREADPTTPLLVSPMNFADPFWLSKLNLDGIPYVVLETHHYAPYVYTHQSTPGPLSYPGSMDTGTGVLETVDKAWIRGRVDFASRTARLKALPLMIGEYGVMRWVNGAPQYLDDLLEAFEQEGLNHAVWLWESASPRITYDQFNFRRGVEPKRRSDLADNPLVLVLKKFWSRNQIFPSRALGKIPSKVGG